MNQNKTVDIPRLGRWPRHRHKSRWFQDLYDMSFVLYSDSDKLIRHTDTDGTLVQVFSGHFELDWAVG
jgi:hypothetical protein